MSLSFYACNRFPTLFNKAEKKKVIMERKKVKQDRALGLFIWNKMAFTEKKTTSYWRNKWRIVAKNKKEIRLKISQIIT